MLRQALRVCAVAALVIIIASPIHANSPFFSDDFWFSLNNWYVNGSVSGSGTSLITSSSTDGASLIYRYSVATGGQHESRAKLALSGGGATTGSVILYLNATNDARYKTSSSTEGKGYAIVADLSHSGGNYHATVSIMKMIWGYSWSLTIGSQSATLTPTSTIKAVRTNAGGVWKIHVYVDDVYLMSATDSEWTAGKPGVGIKGANSGTQMDVAALATIETGAPDYGSLNGSLTTVAAPNQVTLQWLPVTDTAGGSSYGPSGIAYYQVYRGSTLKTTILAQPGSMSYTDNGLTPNTTYNYKVRAYDRHGNMTEVPRDVTTPSPSSPALSNLPRRIGLPPNVSTWGSAPESLDLLSGNLNLTLPVLSAAGRNGHGASLVLSYNSQNWMDSGGTPLHYGKNLGFGYGWKMQFGSVRPVLDGPTLLYYVYEDGTGAEYFLDVYSSGKWRPSGFAPLYEYDPATNRVWFKDGSFWVMDCVSASGEADANTRYPTLMQDVNGNQIFVRYRIGKNATWANSSARIAEIEDVGALPVAGGGRRTYLFSYGTDGALVEKLQQISRNSGLGVVDTTTFTQSTSTIALKSPISGAFIGGTVRFLTKIAKSGAGETNFSYHTNDSGELTRITLPYGGYMDYEYASAAYSGKTVRHVTERKLTPTPGGSTFTYTFTRTSGGTIPVTTRVEDASGVSDKIWTFETNTAQYYYGLWTNLDERELPSGTVKRRQSALWNYHLPAKYFLWRVDSIADPGTGNQWINRFNQWVDDQGNQVSSVFYDSNDLVNPLRWTQYHYAHYTNGTFTTNRIVNRLTKVEFQHTSPYLVLQEITYGNNLDSGIGCPAASNFAGGTYCTSTPFRANVATVTAGGVTTTYKYDYLGNTVRSTGPGPEVTAGFSSAGAFTMPDVITPNGTSTLATSFSYDTDYRPTQTTAPNNAIASTNYDSYGRVVDTFSVTGARTSYTYGIDTGTRLNTVYTRAVSEPGKAIYQKTHMDGLGRPIKAESGGDDWQADTFTDTEYDACACSPSGKVKRVSLPYAPGGTVKWTTYSYDALGRTLSVALPDGAGSTTYLYEKNTVKITDAAGKWKKYESNGLGQLVKVYEPNPAGGADLITTYTYTIRGQLATAVMTRGAYTQTRTFNYELSTGRLLSVTKPETGTTNYTYNSDGTVAHTIDAKNQKTAFTYDSMKRVTNIKRYTWNGSAHVEQACQELINQYDSGGGSNLAGRLGKVTAKQCDSIVTEYNETYSYEPSGLLQYRDSAWKRAGSTTLTRRIDPEWNAMGRMTSFGYGTTGSLYSYAYTYDNAWRPATMTGESLTLVSGINYNAAGAMTAFTRDDGSGTAVNNAYTFNTLYQMTNQTVTKGGTQLQNLSYVFPTTNNNGQILQQIDHLSGEAVEYQYDSLNRLTSAETVGSGGWGLSWVYDGFGNREQQNVTKGSGPTHSVSVSKNTNRIDTAGYGYDPNGNMTTMPLMTVGYDVANRMVSSNHSSAGTQIYGYNQANQRVFVRNGSTVTYYLHGMGGERLMEFQETCTTSCTGYAENQRWIYFAGRKMFSKTGSTLKAITPNRLASEAKHYPYGETQGTPPSDTKDYFATYRRDGTGLDYAMNRYYSPTMGRFTTADPYGGSAKIPDPQSWNRYTYASNVPNLLIDPLGLDDAIACFDDPDDPFPPECLDEFYRQGGQPTTVYVSGGGGEIIDTVWIDVPTGGGGTSGSDDDQSSGDGGTAERFFAPIPTFALGSSNFVEALQKINRARIALGTNGILPECAAFVLAPLGINISDIESFFDRIARAHIISGPESGVRIGYLYQNSTIPGATISMTNREVGDVMSRHGTTAMAELNGVRIFIDPQIINSSLVTDSRLQATLFHEALHNVTGLTDPDLQRKLGLMETPNSSNISARIQDLCISK